LAADPKNTIFGSAGRGMCNPCPTPAAEMPEGTCCAGGTEVHGILGHAAMGKGAVQFNGISAPTDGTYNVDWWYFCGNSDTNGDNVCPWAGQGKGNPPGCRPAQFLINGTPLQMADVQFPCSAGSWMVVHLKTIPMPLKAGANNTIRFFSTGPDAPDLNRIVVHD
jgi:hypothetical protein